MSHSALVPHPTYTISEECRFISEHICAECGSSGAEFHVKSANDGIQPFCHDDCKKAFYGQQSCSEELFGNGNVLCGYSISGGEGGYCIECHEKPAVIASDIQNTTLGFCCTHCASDFDARFQQLKVKNAQVSLDELLRGLFASVSSTSRTAF